MARQRQCQDPHITHDVKDNRFSRIVVEVKIHLSQKCDEDLVPRPWDSLSESVEFDWRLNMLYCREKFVFLLDA
jgi:hypothetical protein